jgi:mono/diheme cytochrome c family protein
MRLVTATIAFLCLAGCGDKGGDSAGAGDHVGDPVAGAKIFASTCGISTCHGPDGSGAKSSAADLHDMVPGKTDDELKAIIQGGFLAMPPTGLSDDKVADVIAYLRQEFGG